MTAINGQDSSPLSDVEAVQRALRREFDGWNIIHTDRGRWWAIRRPALNRATGWPTQHEVSDVDADTAEQLREKLREVES